MHEIEYLSKCEKNTNGSETKDIPQVFVQNENGYVWMAN